MRWGFDIAQIEPSATINSRKIESRNPQGQGDPPPGCGRPYMDTWRKLGLEEIKEWNQLD